VNALRRQLPSLSWIAFLAIAALALLPTFSHALAWAQGQGQGQRTSPYVEICTPQGAKLVALKGEPADATQAPGAQAGHLQHCPLCGIAFDAPPPPMAAVALLLPIASARLPALYLHAPYTLHAWRSAQPRAPPTVS